MILHKLIKYSQSSTHLGKTNEASLYIQRTYPKQEKDLYIRFLTTLQI